MSWHLNIPKILHVYWGGGNLPYIRYMTVRSFMNHNPDWEVNLWHPENMITVKTEGVCEDYLPELMALPITKTVFDARNHGFHVEMSPAQTSDLVSYYVLSTAGGVWADMDIIFFKPISDLAVNTPTNANKETFVCISGHHSIGFLMGCVNNKFFNHIISLSKQNFNRIDNQSIGATMLNKHFPRIESVNRISSVVNIDTDAVYAYNWKDTKDYLTNKMKFTEHSIGAHWYGGYTTIWDDFYKNTNGGLENLSNNIIGNLLKNESTDNSGNQTGVN